MAILWAIMIVMAAMQVPRLVMDRDYRTLAVYLLLWLIGGVYASLVILGVAIPNVTEIIMNLMQPFDIIMNWVNN